MNDPIFAIFEREIERIDAQSKVQALNVDELTRLSILVQSLKNYQKREAEAPENPLAGITTADLLAIINKEKNNEVANGPKPKGPGANRTKGSKR